MARKLRIKPERYGVQTAGRADVLGIVTELAQKTLAGFFDVARDLASVTPVQGAFSAHHSGNQSIPGASHTQLLCDTVDYDETGEYDKNTSKFTAREPGLWLIHAAVYISNPSVGNRTEIVIWKNGAQHMFIYGEQSGGTSTSIARGSALVKVNAGDVLYVSLFSAGATIVPGDQPYKRFSGLRVR